MSTRKPREQHTVESVLSEMMEYMGYGAKDDWSVLYRAGSISNPHLKPRGNFNLAECSELVAKWLVHEKRGGKMHFEVMAECLKNITRKLPVTYLKDRSDRDCYKPNRQNRKGKGRRVEEWMAKVMVRNCIADKNLKYPYLGKAVDYQVLIDKRKKFGDIDIIGVCGRDVVIGELKRPDNPETLIRAILEIYTYAKSFDENQLRILFKECGVGSRGRLVVAPVFFKGSNMSKENEVMKDPKGNLQRLIKCMQDDLAAQYENISVQFKMIELNPEDFADVVKDAEELAE